MSAQTIHTILAQFREDDLHNRHLGDRFERLMCRYFELDPMFADRFSNIWMWNEWPKKGDTGDVGIDIVAEERATGEFCGIQCKFYQPEHTLSKEDIDSFLSALGDKRFTSGLIVCTTDKWGSNAEKALLNRDKPVGRLRMEDLDQSPIDWSHFNLKNLATLKLREKKGLRPHQVKARLRVREGFEASDRGKLIMACGTGKTLTALRIAEEQAPGGTVLFLVPSLSLLSQSLREWTAEAETPIHALAVCSDVNIGKHSNRDKPGEDDTGDFTLSDLSFPATTSAKELLRHFNAIAATGKKKAKEKTMTVVFSTYHSIDAVSKAQKAGLPEFDLIICDEAHRTTGVTLANQDESHFVKVHDAKFIQAKKRLYMTATPRLYGDDAKAKAQEAAAELCSMDDEAMFGPEFHRLGFGEAVSSNLLTDYKVLVLAVDEKYVSKTFQRQIADADNALKLDDAVKITGCWNGLAKRLDHSTASAADLQGDTAHMTRAVAFSRSIKDSKAFVRQMADLITAYQKDHPEEEKILQCQLDHVDGGFNALQRNALLDWLKAPAVPNRCRILSNARCLSEGVDVPALDAVLFLNPRNSVVDVVQSVGRVMRRAPGKQYGYIILPIGIPADTPPEEALKDNQKYKVVWQVLQALRAHDDRFNATINQIELNQKAPNNLQIIGIGGAGGDDGSKSSGDGKDKPAAKEVQGTFFFPQLEEWKNALYAKIVLKCGSRRYWEDWARDVAKIAQRHSDRIRLLLEQGEKKHTAAFDAFLAGLHQNINTAITREEAIEMLSQHLITRPVFDALFENYTFSEQNPVSQAMQSMLAALQDQALEKETASLEKFYVSVRQRVEGIDNAEGRQKVIIELYDKFFKEAFPKMAERLGIVYTPVEVVDFIIHSVEDVLQHEFKSSVTDKDVHIIDPFTGTGTFIVRLLQSGLIKDSDLLRKYQHELHANEIVLLAYYIAAINIEETFHGLHSGGKHPAKVKDKPAAAYQPFEGIVLTDTFQLTETRDYHQTGEEKMFPENNRRVKRQKQSPIRVVIGNPPYSVTASPVPYANLDERIRTTYAAASSATNLNSLYDSYIRALRWASDRIEDRGVIGFVSNNSFIDGNTQEGLRASLTHEFTSIYVFNLRGNQRTSGETSRMEGGKIFGSGSRTGIAIYLLVKNPKKLGACKIQYYDIGDYLDREEKLGVIAKLASINGLHRENKWQLLQPNTSHDWVNQRDPAFAGFPTMGDKDEAEPLSYFESYSRGLATSRDNWCYNFSQKAVASNIGRMIDFYREQVREFQKTHGKKPKNTLPELAVKWIDRDAKKISWSRGLIADVAKGKEHYLDSSAIRPAWYRPFCQQWVYFSRALNDMIYQTHRIYPERSTLNRALCITSPGNRVGFSVMICDAVPDLHMSDTSGASQCFPLYLYEKDEPEEGELLSVAKEGELVGGYRRRSAITDAMLVEFHAAYGKKVAKEDIFYYVYGVLHSPEYRTRFASDLKKMLPRIPLTKESADFWKFSQAGRELAEWHLNYETVEPWPVKEHTSSLSLDPEKDYLVTKMTFARPSAEQKAQGMKWNKTTIHYNAQITLTDIPLEAYDYVVNGKPALEWIMERYQISVDKESGIKNDPNDWSREHHQPRYILDLVKRIVRVSLETMKIVNALPALNEKS